ncbi:zf-HC2 domain-containing protein [Mycetocola sp. 2940]|uniref:anti-sigma factor family protein n=1 Tax=Mycetocola sp. 2940 TaxID=3156452 RepID=UPI003394CDAE
MTVGHDVYREWDAAYVLGALSPEERHAFERHLGDCARCSAAVTELAGMPGLLGLLSSADAGAAGDGGITLREGAHERVTLQKLAAAVQADRKRTRRLVAGAAVIAAGLLVTAGIALGATVIAPGGATPAAATFEMAPLASGTLTADIAVTPKKWGTLLAWECRYEDPPWADPASDPAEVPEYALVVTQTDGIEIVVATWRAAGERAAGLSAATSIPTDDISKVEIRTLPEMHALARATL